MEVEAAAAEGAAELLPPPLPLDSEYPGAAAEVAAEEAEPTNGFPGAEAAGEKAVLLIAADADTR